MRIGLGGYGAGVPLPDALARFNRRVTNRLMLGIAPRLPPLAVVDHVGRRSGRQYRTPVMAFDDGERWTFALTYGPDRDWVHNVLAAGELTIERAGHRVHLVDLHRVAGDEGLAHVAPYTRPVLRALHVDQFLTGVATL
jgi:deazaflavin-dependent oxidoreductase (nitroreductase family)